MRREDAQISTRVGIALHGDSIFRGHAVDADLAGRASLAGLVALAVTGRRYDEHDCAVLDAIASSCLAADPRLWPMKIGAVCASFGRFVPGFVAAQLSLESDALGPNAVIECAALLLDVADTCGARGVDVALVRQVVRQRLDSGRRISGFGTPFRAKDERMESMIRVIPAILRRPHYWTLARALADVMHDLKGVSPNAGLGVAAALLDLGCNPNMCGAIMMALFAPNFIAPAFERACEPSAVLQELPVESVRYTGPPPRLSPRALAAQASERATKPSGDAGSGSAPE